MLSAEVIQRLESLNRQRLPTVAPRAQPPAEAPQDCSLSALVRGALHTNHRGTHYRVVQPVAEIWPAAPRRLLAGEPPEADSASGDSPSAAWHPELSALAGALPRGALLIDLETCGFAGSAIFLIGLLHWHENQLVLEHLLARDYREEPAVLDTLWQRVAGNTLLVSFNGKSFDWPMVCDRSVMHRLLGPEAAPPALPHCDLLHHARRRWRRALPNCKLQTLERAVCRRVRHDDIPGHQIPHEYHAFVRTGDARQLARIVHHNTLDLVTLAELAWRLVSR
jgi:hypothetical protein